MKKAIIFLIFTLSVINLLNFWRLNLKRFQNPYDFKYFSDLYSNSQYVLGEKSKGGIGDDGLYAFSAYYYFMQKGDVSAVNFEHPPLGKYLIGLSIFLFNNEIVINIFYFLALLLVVYKIARLYLNKYLSLLPLNILMLDPLFLDHTIRSQLDLPFTLFFVSAVYFFLKTEKNNINLYLSQFFWGAAFSTRFFPFLIILEILMFLILFKNQRKFLSHHLISVFIVPIVYLITHISFFVYHPSLMEFINHKKWMLSWFRGTPVKPFNIIRNIFSGYLLDSTDILVKNKEWSVLQPLVVFFSILPFRFTVLYFFTFVYLIYIILATGGQAKFLMPVFPLMAVLAVKNLVAIYSIILPWMRLKLLSLKRR